jgi:hypothetical protein
MRVRATELTEKQISTPIPIPGERDISGEIKSISSI